MHTSVRSFSQAKQGRGGVGVFKQPRPHHTGQPFRLVPPRMLPRHHSCPQPKGELPGLDSPTHRPLTLTPASGPVRAEHRALLRRLLPRDISLAQPSTAEPPPLAGGSSKLICVAPSSVGHLEPAPLPPARPPHRPPQTLRKDSCAFRPFCQISSHPQDCILLPRTNSPALKSTHGSPPELHIAPFKMGPLAPESPSPHSGTMLLPREPPGLWNTHRSPLPRALTCSRGSRFHPIYPCGGQAAGRLRSPA